jgi:signal transduction histidine kinase
MTTSPPSGTVAAGTHTEDPARTRTEQIIAGARMTLVVAALITLSLDSTQPARYEATYVALVVYVLYAVALGILAWRAYAPSRRMLFVIHGIDLVAPSVLVAVFDGPPISPFFVFFVFSLFAATLRWNWRGTVWTGGCALGLFGVAGLVVSQFVLDELVYLAVVAGLLAYMGAWEQRRRTEVARLAAWPASVPADLRTAVMEALQHAASTLGVRRIVLAWAEDEEPGRYVAYLAGDEFRLTQDPEQEMRALVAADVTESVFFCPDARLSPARVLIGSTGEFQAHVAPIERGFVARFAIGTVLSVPLSSGEWQGQLFVLDKRRTTPDDMVLARIVGQQIAARLEHHYLVQRLQHSAIVQERLGFARDLHDGLLQALTGIALQVQTALAVMPTSPARARERLEEVQRQIRVAQRSLRSYIRDLKPRILFDDHASADLATRLRRLMGRLRREWDIEVDVDMPAVLAAGRAGIGYHVMHLVHEGVVNAVRHGRASRISVVVHEDARNVDIRIADNGCGFPFHGRHDLKALQDMRAGPATLKDRVAALRGTIVVESGALGARIEMTIPLASVTDAMAEPLKRPGGG